MRAKFHGANRKVCGYRFAALFDEVHAGEVVAFTSSNVLLSAPTIFGAFAILPAILDASSHGEEEILSAIKRLTGKPRLLETIEAFKGGMALALKPDGPRREALIVKAVT